MVPETSIILTFVKSESQIYGSYLYLEKMLDRIISEIETGLNAHPDRWATRFTPFWHYRRPENNIFSLASTLFILQELEPRLSPENRQKTAAISRLITREYPRFQNKDGRITFNFYPTRPSEHFPNGYLMQHLDHFRLPDDIDDTALITLTLKTPPIEVQALKDLTETFAEDLPSGQRVYSTWYGKNMPKEQDVCALLNLLYLFHTHTLPLTRTDYDTFAFLREKAGEALSRPFEIARHYATPALILYHYSRFMSRFPSPLDPLRPLIISALKEALTREKVFMNRVIMESALIKMEEKRAPLDLSQFSSKGFHTFIGAPFAPFNFSLLKKWAAKPAYQIFWHSDIHQKALLAEYLVLSSLNS